MHSTKRRLRALECSKRFQVMAEDNRPLRIDLVTYNPGQPDHGQIGCSWVRSPGEAEYRHVVYDRPAP
jgi:hypothetical protein